jgi:putative membrane protein
MMMSALSAFFHHVAAFTVFACAAVSFVLLQAKFDLDVAKKLQRTDMVNGIAATLVLLIGLVRVFYTEKSADFYFHNVPFLAKITLYGLASILSIVPTLEIVRWTKTLQYGQLPVVSVEKIGQLRAVAAGQVLCLLGMMLCASWAARGVGALG